MKSELESVRAFFYPLVVLLFLFAVAPASAQTTEERIRALEEVQRANAAELARLKGEQIELKKEATAAVAKLPTFSYRPRSGVTIAAADRSWSITQTLLFQTHMYNHTDGNDRRGATTGDLFFRRFRPQWTLCVSDCMYEWHVTMDFDTGDVGEVQNTGLFIRFSKVNPWLPDLSVADEESSITWTYVTRSSSTSAQVEKTSDLLADDLAGAKLSRRHIGLGWRDKPLLSMPGTFDLTFEYQIGGGITENDTSDTDRKQFLGTIGARPFVRSKNPWLQRLRLGGSAMVTSVDSRSAQQGRRLRVRSDERVGRFALFDANGIGDGLAHDLSGGVEWGFGPYLIRADGGYAKFESGEVGTANNQSHVRGWFWSINNEIFLWSPKGFLTGRAYVPGSLQLGWGFSRADGRCGTPIINGGFNDCVSGTGLANNVRLLKRELDLWYYWNTFSRIGLFWNWWDSDNTPSSIQQAVGCKTRPTDVGKECDWHTINLALQVYF